MEDCGLHKAITIGLKRGRFSQSFRAKVMALDLRGDLGAASKLIIDNAANFRAMELAAKFNDGPGTPFMAVYLVAPDEFDVVKIGIAADPKLRLSTLQIGNWNKLSVRGLLWFDRGAGLIERLSHLAAKEMGIDIRGEWVSTSVEEAAEIVLKAARYAKATCYDSDIWLKNWASRVDALAEASGISKRIAA